MMTRREFIVLSAAGAGLLLLSGSTARALTDIGIPSEPSRQSAWLHGNARTGCAQAFPMSPDSFIHDFPR